MSPAGPEYEAILSAQDQPTRAALLSLLRMMPAPPSVVSAKVHAEECGERWVSLADHESVRADLTRENLALLNERDEARRERDAARQEANHSHNTWRDERNAVSAELGFDEDEAAASDMIEAINDLRTQLAAEREKCTDAVAAVADLRGQLRGPDPLPERGIGNMARTVDGIPVKAVMRTKLAVFRSNDGAHQIR